TTPGPCEPADLAACYRACRRTVGPVTLQRRPPASVPLKVDWAVCAAADVLHQRVRSVVDPLAGICSDGFERDVTAPSNESTRSVTVTAAPPTSRSTWS